MMGVEAVHGADHPWEARVAMAVGLGVVALLLLVGLWWFCRYQAQHPAGRWMLVLAVSCVVFCGGLVGWFLCLATARPWHSVVPRDWVEGLVLPIYALMPFAVSLCALRVLARLGLSRPWARHFSFALGTLTWLSVPLQWIVVSCGMAGACF